MNRAIEGARALCALLDWKIAALGAGLLLSAEAHAGDVRGSVRASEEAKTRVIEAVRAPYWQEWNGFIEPKKAGVDYAREVCAVLTGPMETRDATTIALRGGALMPSTIVAQHGLPLRIRNEDDFGHELYVEGLKSFEPVETKPGHTRTVQLDQTGVFVVRDRLAPHVRGVLHVIAKLSQVASPNADGTFTFHDVPPGKYTLQVYRGQSASALSELDVTGSRELQLDPIALPTEAKPGK